MTSINGMTPKTPFCTRIWELSPTVMATIAVKGPQCFLVKVVLPYCYSGPLCNLVQKNERSLAIDGIFLYK